MSDRRILVDARLPWGSGIGRYVRNILPPVAARMPDAAFTLLVAPADAVRAGEVMAPHANVTVRASPIRPFSLAEQLRLPLLARRYDLTWFTNYWVPLGWRGRFVATVHDLIHLDPAFPTSRLRRVLAARTFAKIRRDAAHVVFVSRFTHGAFTARLGPPRAASVVHHGIDHLGAGSGDPVAPRERFALVVAAAKAHKNLPLLLDAWARAALPDWRLVLVTPADDLRSSIDLAPVPGLTIRRGIADAELAGLYASAGFVIVPSRHEGFGLPLLEAMRAGAPVLASTAPALVEVAGDVPLTFVSPDDRDGWVVAIRAMAAGCVPLSPRQAAIAAQGHAHARGFTWARAADATARVLEAALP
ncbi:glycosyltransferase family 1 protein [Sphingomonas sp. KR1UV-12]|uniref:Glycosyltransferase family 1 protein n=1 Tax=Sphingomonas aurea TaxID=3063994 RepID=A0ABT9EPA1_9SPHN|nr:glycosyltransferase family 1 protein [Sphingomonas sp. KR1UV-12]MDP1028787.1 glycosyltransferase family 1 protein [Sphingomonas sp. KR1UV-12]